MIKKKLTVLFTAALCGACITGMNAGAATIDEVAATARSLGFPESVVQQGINEYNADPDFYTADVLDEAISYLYSYEAELKTQLGITDVPDKPADDPSVEGNNSTTEPPAQNNTSSPQTPTVSGGTTGNTVSGNNSSTSGGSSSPSVSVPSGSGSTSADIPNKPEQNAFINMTLEEKREYVSTLTPEQQQIFFSLLTPEELKSIVKQLPSGDKAEVVDTFVKAGEAMGVQITVDEFSDDSISMSMRNNDGDLIDVASIGIIIEDTGYDYRLHFAAAGILIFAAAGGIWLVKKKCFSEEESGAER